MISLTLQLTPVAKGRARFGLGRIYTPAKTIRFERDAKALVVSALKLTQLVRLPFTTPLKLTAKFFVQQPKRPRFLIPAVKPDLDNYMKAIKDALNGVLWKDDSLICEYGIGTGKFYGTPRIELIVEEL